MTPDPTNWLYAMLALLMWLGLLGWTIRQVRRAYPDALPTDGLLIGYASQSGYACDLAQATAKALSTRARPIRALPLDRIEEQMLATASRALFIASTTGEGDAPDNAAAFARHLMRTRPSLGHLSYGLLALGDRSYTQFCSFGRSIDDWLSDCGARPIFPRIEMNQAQPDAFSRWLQQISLGFGQRLPQDVPQDMPQAKLQQRLGRWQLTHRDLLNPGSPGGALFHLGLTPLAALPIWQPGDIATIDIPLAGGGSVQREYSLASLPADGRAELIVRQVTDAAGGFGRGSGWLTETLKPGGSVQMRIRENRGFHSPDPHHPMILIGSGSGLSGLMAHIRQRAPVAGHGLVWLIYGERSPHHDAILDPLLQGWLRDGALHRLDRSFSRGRSAESPRYVHDLIRNHGPILSDWVDQNASIYICGRREGMAQDVQNALIDTLGEAAFHSLVHAGRIRRDVY